MPSAQSAAKVEREKKLKAVLTFASTLSKRIEAGNHATIIGELQAQIPGLPLKTSSAVTARQEEVDRLGTELWNQATRLRRDISEVNNQPKDSAADKTNVVPFLRAYAFLLLDSAGGRGPNNVRQRKSCIRLMKVALKAARVCIEANELIIATDLLKLAAEYEDVLSKGPDDKPEKDTELADGLRAQYFAVRMTLSWRQDQMGMAEHMFEKCRQVRKSFTSTTTEQLADLLYEIGKALLAKRDYEVATRWLERAFDVLGEQDLDMLSPEIGELRLSIMQSLVKAYMKTKTPITQEKAWQMVKLMETDFGDKMIVSLLKIELLSEAETMDTSEFYNGELLRPIRHHALIPIVLLRMIRTIVLNDTNFKTIMHYIHKLKEHSNATACKVLDDLIDIRLFREENQSWIEKAVITRIWIGINNSLSENSLEQLIDLFDTVAQNSKVSLSAPATHAAQTLLWKKVEAASSQEQHDIAEAWCRACLHDIFEKAGVQNKTKVARKIIQCALSRQDFEAAREVHAKMPESGKDDPVTRYLMYKAGLRGGDEIFAAECLDYVCRSSAKDATLLYACVMEAQSAGSKRQAINALEKVLEKYEHSAPAGIHLPALLRSTARMLESELVKDGNIDTSILEQICNVFEGACVQAKASRIRPSTPAKELFTAVEFEWFSKNAYNMSLKYCAEMSPGLLVRLLGCCTEFIKLLQEKTQPNPDGDLCLRLVFCEFLAACTYTTLARAEDNTKQSIGYYLEAHKHSQEFRRTAAESISKLGGASQDDIMSKYFQIVKLELEAVLKLERWDELDDLFDQCWKYKNPDHYETLADLVLVVHGCIVKAGLENKYQKSRDITKLARWLRCMFSLSLEYDEEVSIKCIQQVTHLAAKQRNTLHPTIATAGLDTPPPSSDFATNDDTADLADECIKEIDCYPKSELEWLASTAFNRAVDFYLSEDDVKTKKWADQAFIVAQWIDDNGAMRDFLMDRFANLKFGDGEESAAVQRAG
ncbi:uncharacterized protein J4E88_008023 [Alternaria novae-zelandiae]|uniref:uncharacterized protein n=1 Tax=Alternaria novae-zelandiae TaxID=430562 RepID=UPI0020C59E1C|nr:uncharacterized protein J4E88_008023 [Alternaria novae-zelandiae]KAI4675119.1 hypothetical protein J4E88_008023 [Alternaria novae-zelandiae]